MLGDIDTRQIYVVDGHVRSYPGHDNVVEITLAEREGRSFTRLDFSAVTRFIAIFTSTGDEFVFDTSITPGLITGNVAGTIELNLSAYAMPETDYSIAIIAYDAQHPDGQVVIDGKIDSEATISVRLVSGTGTLPPPTVEYVTEAPNDGELYGRQNENWVPITDVVAGVASVNGETGIVVLDATDVGADATGTAAAAVVAHEAAVNPHPQYATDTDLAAHVASTTPHSVITQIDRAGFNTAAGLTAGVGEMVWNATDGTVDIGLPGGVTLQSGQEFLVRGLNNSGTLMTNMTAVYISGASGNRVVFTRAQANVIVAERTIGLLTQDIANNQEGFCTLAGLVRNVDTSAWAEGSPLWLSATVAGGITNVVPPSPNRSILVGYVVRSHPSIGSIFVRVNSTGSLAALHDVNVVAPQDNDILVYNAATSTWLNEPNTGGSGEANTASNLGAGVGVWAQKVGVDLQFKSLVAGAGITLTPTANTITITGAGGGGAVDSVNGQTGVVVLDTDDIDEGVSNLYFTNARASAAAPVQTVDGQTGTVSLTSSYAAFSHVGSTDGHPLATTSLPGLQSAADKAKLDGIAPGAQVNVPTDLSLGTITSTTIPLNSSTGTDVVLPAATTSLAGLQSSADKTKLDGIASGAQVNVPTDLSLGTITGTTIPLNSSTGADVVLPAATTSLAGLQSAADKTKLDSVNVSATPLPVVQTLSSTRPLALVDNNTFNVNTTTNDYVVTIPEQASVAWLADTEIHFLPSNSGDITITAAAGVSLNGVVAGSVTLSTQNGAASIKRMAADTWWVGGTIGTLAEQQAALGIALQTSPTDTVAGRLMAVGAFGLGGSAATTVTDANAATVNGFCTLVSPYTNGPLSAAVTLHTTAAGFNGWLAQVAISYSSLATEPRLFMRRYNGTAWSAWAEVFNSGAANAVSVDTGSIGYGVGSGGTVTQATSKTTGVTLNKPVGRITTNNAALAANTSVSFFLSNTIVGANDFVYVQIAGGAADNTVYSVRASVSVAGSVGIVLRNESAGSLSEAVNIKFIVIKGAIA